MLYNTVKRMRGFIHEALGVVTQLDVLHFSSFMIAEIVRHEVANCFKEASS